MKWKGNLVIVKEDDDSFGKPDLKHILGSDDEDVKLDLIYGTLNDDNILFVSESTLMIDGDDSTIFLIVTGSDVEVDKIYFLSDEQEKFKKEWKA